MRTEPMYRQGAWDEWNRGKEQKTHLRELLAAAKEYVRRVDRLYPYGNSEMLSYSPETLAGIHNALRQLHATIEKVEGTDGKIKT